MSLKDIAGRYVATVGENAPLTEASRLMHERHVGCLVVVNQYGGKRLPTGIVTDRDLALAIGHSPNIEHLSVKHVMAPHPVVAFEEDGVFETMEAMRKNGIKRMPVVDAGGSLVGIVSADDLLSLLSSEFAKLSRISEVQIRREEEFLPPVNSHIRF